MVSFAEPKLIIFFPLGFIISVVFLLCNKLGCGSNVYTRSTFFFHFIFVICSYFLLRYFLEYLALCLVVLKIMNLIGSYGRMDRADCQSAMT